MLKEKMIYGHINMFIDSEQREKAYRDMLIKFAYEGVVFKFKPNYINSAL